MIQTHYPMLDERVYRTVLENGLPVTVIKREGFSRRLAYLAVDYGSMHTEFEFEGETHRVPDGIAHYLEHKMFDMPDGQDVSAKFAEMGAMVNAFTSFDMTAYYFTCTENFENCLKTLLEFVTTPYFTEETVEKERGIIDQEIGMNLDSPESRIFEDQMAAAFYRHPVRVPILGTRESIRQITPGQLHLVHRAFYAPANMMLCVVGDVDPEQVARTARQVLGSEKRAWGKKPRDWGEPLTCREQRTSRRMEVAMPMFHICFKSPALPDGEEGIRLEMAADLAAETLLGESSALYLRLYEAGIIDASFGGGFETLDGISMLTCGGDSEEPEAVLEAILEEAARIAREGVDPDAFRRMKRSALGRRIRSLDSFDATCFRTCACQLTDFDYFRFPGIYAQIQPEDIRTFLETCIRKENSCLSIVYPPEKF